MAKASTKIKVGQEAEIEEVLRYYSPIIGNLIRVETDNDRYSIVTDKLTGTLQKHDGFYYLAYITDVGDGWDSAIGLMVFTKKTLARMLQTHAPDRALKNWQEKIKESTAIEIEEDLLQTYSIFRFLQRTR